MSDQSVNIIYFKVFVSGWGWVVEPDILNMLVIGTSFPYAPSMKKFLSLSFGFRCYAHCRTCPCKVF